MKNAPNAELFFGFKGTQLCKLINIVGKEISNIQKTIILPCNS